MSSFWGPFQIRADGSAVVHDRLGSVMARSEIAGGGVSRFDYFPYGGEMGAGSAENRDKFGTYSRDQTTGLDYADQRYFVSLAGRFTSSDPYEASGGVSEPGSWNRYPYVGGDPVNNHDPRGLYAEQPDVGSDIGGFSGGNAWGDPFEGLGSKSGMNGPMRARSLACLNPPCIYWGSGPDGEIDSIELRGIRLVFQGDSRIGTNGFVDASNLLAPVAVGGAVVVIVGGVAIYVSAQIIDAALKEIARRLQVSRGVMADDCEDEEKEGTPTPGNERGKKFEPVRGGGPGGGCKIDQATGEMWCPDRLHKDHWEVYKKRNDGDKPRTRSVWNSGCIRQRF